MSDQAWLDFGLHIICLPGNDTHGREGKRKGMEGEESGGYVIYESPILNSSMKERQT
jgi:hypothetical protein